MGRGSDDLNVRPLGAVHPRECCHECGSRESLQEQVIVGATRAVGWRCVDTIACLRKKRRDADRKLYEQQKLCSKNPRSAA